jgi:murein L,D-transpeptidase YafK
MTKRLVLAAGLALALAACQDQSNLSTRHLTPIPPATTALMASKGMSQGDPILMRAYKKESELELWKKGRDGRYALLKTYPICRWSGQLGPKVKEGDRQAPEGFYTVTPGHMNPNSSFYLSFDTGYPNAFDRAHGRTGSHLMVHGTCSSRGCFAITDEAIAEVYAVAREAFAGGQRGFQFQSYPFRMTPQNLAKHRADPNIAFWRNLKEGADYFEVMKEEPSVSVANMRYHFGADHPAVAQKRAADEQKVAELVGTGVTAVRTVYDDGGGHNSFGHAMATAAGDSDSRSVFAFLGSSPSRKLGDVSRPEALATGPREVPIDTAAKGKPQAAKALASTGPAKPVAPSQTATAKPDQKPGAASAGDGKGASAAQPGKPEAAAPAPQRRASVSGTLMPGSQPALPAGNTGFARLN